MPAQTVVGPAVVGPAIRTHLIVSDERVERGELAVGAHVLSGGQLALRGHASGPVRVDAGGQVIVDGRLSGSLVVEPGGSAALHGQIDGVVRNCGRTRISGVFSGRILQNSGVIEVAAGTVVNYAGRFLVLRPDGTLGVIRADSVVDRSGAPSWLTYLPGGRFTPVT